jgi:hypothetical protein
VSAQFANNNCMLAGDSADWVKFVAPTGCVAVEVQVRLQFPVAFEELGFELWDLDHDMKMADESTCMQGADTGFERRCLDFTLVGGTNYGVKVHPTGVGNCDGACSYNRYALQVQLGTP